MFPAPCVCLQECEGVDNSLRHFLPCRELCSRWRPSRTYNSTLLRSVSWLSSSSLEREHSHLVVNAVINECCSQFNCQQSGSCIVFYVVHFVLIVGSLSSGTWLPKHPPLHFPSEQLTHEESWQAADHDQGIREGEFQNYYTEGLDLESIPKDMPPQVPGFPEEWDGELHHEEL